MAVRRRLKRVVGRIAEIARAVRHNRQAITAVAVPALMLALLLL